MWGESMNRIDLLNKIYSLKNDEEIEKFVKERLQELDETAEEKIIGQGYTDIYRGFIGQKTHFKAVGSTDKFKCPDLVFDYITPYINVIKEIKKMSEYDDLYLLSIIFYELNDLSNIAKADLVSRTAYYYNARNNSENVSIKKIFSTGDAFCSERSAMVHNIFKLLGIDSELVIGYRDSEPHVYNVIFIKGYDQEPMILFDSSHFVTFKNDESNFSCAYFYGFKKDKYDEMILGNSFTPIMSKTEEYYRHKFGFDEKYKFEVETPKYVIGINNNPNKKVSLEELKYLAHNENGIETVSSNKVMR